MRPIPIFRVVFSISLVILCLPLGCASPGEAGQGGAASRSSNAISEEELQEVFVPDLYQAVERLRPRWLQSRGSRSFTGNTEIAVVQDGIYVGDIEQLRAMQTVGVVRLEYLDAATAAAQIAGVVGRDRVIEAAILVSHGRTR
jgi:hypothetical protein